MRYLPHTENDIDAMLQVVGNNSLDDLFSTVPDACRMSKPPDLPGKLTEWELGDLLGNLSRTIATSPYYKVFIGAGSYEHFIPATVSYLLSRSEFSTAYTPYQSEMSQGTLQAIYEYQTLLSRLLGMEVSNASLYDGASALAEALLMAIRITKKKTVAVSSLIHPNYRRVINTYFKPTGFQIIEMPYLKNGRTDISAIEKADDLAAVAIQSPNFFGCIEDIKAVSDAAHKKNALSVTSFTEPLVYGLFKNPGSQDADIACGEGQSFGISQSFGGPALGMFAGKMKHVRSMPGRLVGKTKDTDGKRGFVLTLAAREQHIRREKATSNICTNSNLNALAASMYMASLGGTGISELARLNYDKAEYLKKELKKAGIKTAFNSPTFNEFVVRFLENFEQTYNTLIKKKIVAGLPLVFYYPELDGHYLLCVTEVMTKNHMDQLVKEVTS